MKKLTFIIFSLLLSSCSTKQPILSSPEPVIHYTEIADMIKKGEGDYTIQGTVIKKSERTNENEFNLWIQNHNHTESAMLIKNCLYDYESIQEGMKISIQGYYKEEAEIPTMYPNQIKVLNLRGETYTPYIINNETYAQLTDQDMHRLVRVEDIQFISSQKNQASATKGALTLSFLIDTSILQDLITESIANHVTVDCVGILGKKKQILLLQEEDIKFHYPSFSEKIHLYGINDFHGSVIQQGDEAGILSIGSYFKSLKNQENTLLINAGDFWQGAIESNYNYGQLLTDCMNEIEFSSFTLGNHEFDWGEMYIQQNRKRESRSGYKTPFLAANVYHYDMKKAKVLDYAELGEPYTIQTLENGLRVGIIGVIGKHQITSISSQNVDHLSFVEPTKVICELSDELRLSRNVDVVIVSAHQEQSELISANYGITQKSSKSNQRYVDAVFCAHSHQAEKEISSGVPFVQAGSNGRYYDYIQLDVTNELVTCKEYSVVPTYLMPSMKDQQLEQIIETYKTISDKVGNEVLATLSGDFYRSSTLTNFVTAAMVNYAKKNKITIDYALCNTGRADLSSGTLTYAQLYKALPFDNEIYILEVSGDDLLKELNYTSMYRVNKKPFDEKKTYRIAVLDYLAFHRNEYRMYDYFPSLKIIGKLEKKGQNNYNYRELTADYMRTFSKEINASDYGNSIPCHNKELLFTSI